MSINRPKLSTHLKWTMGNSSTSVPAAKDLTIMRSTPCKPMPNWNWKTLKDRLFIFRYSHVVQFLHIFVICLQCPLLIEKQILFQWKFMWICELELRLACRTWYVPFIFKSQSKIECLWNYFASFCECHKCSTSALVSNIPWSDIYKFLEFCYFDYISLDVDLIVCRGLKRGPQDDLVDKVKVYMLCLSLIASFTSITISHLTLFICFDLNVHGFTQKVVLYLKLNKSFSNTGFGEISINTHCSNVKNIILSDFQSIGRILNHTSWIWI